MDMAAVPVSVTRSVSAGEVFLEYCLTLWSNLSGKVMCNSKWDYGSPEIWFLSKYRFKKDLGVAKWVVPNLYLWPASKLSCLHTFKSVIVALVCLKQDKYINLHIFFELVCCFTSVFTKKWRLWAVCSLLLCLCQFFRQNWDCFALEHCESIYSWFNYS